MNRIDRRSCVVRPLAGVALTCMLAPAATAQVVYSLDFRSIEVNQLDGSTAGRVITPGTVLTPPGGTPQIPPQGVPFRPLVLIGGGLAPGGITQTSLGVPSHDDCIGTPAGVRCGYDLDALSFGFDDRVEPGAGTFFAGRSAGDGGALGVLPSSAWSHFLFSVDDHAGGVAGVGIEPNVESESRIVAGMRAGDSAADVFVTLDLPAPPLDASVSGPGAVGYYDGNALRSTSTLFLYPGLGLIEPTLPTPAPMPSTGDDLDALDDCGVPFPGATFPVWFSLDSAYFDPKEGDPLAGSAAASGFVGGDVLVTVASGALPMVYASAASLGLDQTLPDRDDLDALVLTENGVTGYQRSLTPYDWMTGSTDMLLFSVRRASAIIGSPDSIFGLPIEEGDVLVPPVAGGNGNPGIFIAAERLGLRTLRAFDPCGDDLDALDHCTVKKLLAAEYCYGDGGLTPGCTTCPCGNNVPAGDKTGCANSNGTGARLLVSGYACASADTLRFEMIGGNPSTFGVLVGGANRLPLMGGCLPGSGVASVALDGLRCIGGSLFRHGSRATSPSGSIGLTNAGWGPPNGPAGGLLAQGGYTAGQTKQFQVFYRELATLVCMRGQNTSSAVQVVVVP